jgi:hypothetical protein
MRLLRVLCALALLATAYEFAPAEGVTAPSTPPSRAVFRLQRGSVGSIIIVDPVGRSVVSTFAPQEMLAASTVCTRDAQPRLIVGTADTFTEVDLDGGVQKALYRCTQGFRPAGAAYAGDGAAVLWQGAADGRFSVVRVQDGDIERAQVDFTQLFGKRLAPYAWVSPWTVDTMMFLGTDATSAYFANSSPLPWHWEQPDLTVWRADFVGGTIRQQGATQPWPPSVPLTENTGDLLRRWGLPTATSSGIQLVPMGEATGLPVPAFGSEILIETGGERYLELLRPSPYALTIVQHDIAAPGERLAYKETQHGLAVPLGMLPGEVLAYTFSGESAGREFVELHLRDPATGLDTAVVTLPAPAEFTYLGAF